MKTAIKLVLIYVVIQLLAALAVLPAVIIYLYIKYKDIGRAEELALIPAMLLGFVLMFIYLRRTGYLRNDKKIYSPVSASYLLWSLLMGISSIFIIDYLMSYLTFLPDWSDNTFDVLQSGWMGIICITLLGPILEELLFRGAITKVLLQKYNPIKAILISGLLFGIFHMNPVQTVPATLIGFVLAGIYYKAGSVIPCILIHILNNSLSVYFNIKFPDVESTPDLIGEHTYLICVLFSIGLFLLSWKMINSYKQSDITTIEV